MGCGASTSSNPGDEHISQPGTSSRFIRKELLGKGTYGRVYRCIDSTNNQEYAMKVVRVSAKTKTEAARHIEQLKSEISVLKKLNHRNIVKYQSFDVTANLEEVEIVMELVESGTLRDYIEKNGPLTELVASQIGAKILTALVYLHSQNIIHRDLKCANVLLTEDLTPKLTDFGTAKIIPNTDIDDIAKISASLKGTPYYMAPEVLKRTGHNHSADIWSFGCMVIQMLSGKVPWSNHSAKFSQIIGYISSGIHPPFPPHLTKQCTNFLQSCLDPVPSRRLEASQLLKNKFIDRSANGAQRLPPSAHKQTASKQKALISNRAGSRDTLRELEGIELDELDDSYQNGTTLRKNTDSSNSKHMNGKTQSHRRKTVDKRPIRKHTAQIMDQISQLDRLEAEINEVSVDEEDIPKDRYYIKKTLAQLKKSKHGKHISKTSTTVKNTEDNLLSIDNSVSEYQPRSNTEMSREEEAINTMIARAERDRYMEQQKIFQKQRDDEKRKWQEELKEGAQMLKREFSSRYELQGL